MAAPRPLDSEVAPLPPHCVKVIAGGSEVENHNLKTTAAQLAETCQAARATLTGDASHPAAAKLSSVDSFVRVLLDATPLPVELALLVSDYRLFHSPSPLWVSPSMGPRHPDSRAFSTFDSPTGKPLAAVLRDGWCVRQVNGVGGQYANGIQFVYGPAHPVHPDDRFDDERDLSMLNSGRFLVSRPAAGTHHHPSRFAFRLVEDEYLTRFAYHAGQWADHLELGTNLGRVFHIGSSRGGTRHEVTAPAGSALIGFHGTVGGHLHALSGVFAAVERHRRLTPAERQGQREPEPSPDALEDSDDA